MKTVRRILYAYQCQNCEAYQKNKRQKCCDKKKLNKVKISKEVWATLRNSF